MVYSLVRRALAASATIVAAGLLAGCPSAPTQPDPEGVTVTVDAISGALVPGGSGIATLRITRTNGFAGAVKVTEPPVAIGTFNYSDVDVPSAPAGTVSVVQVPFTVSSNAATGSSVLPFDITGDGIATFEATVPVAIAAPGTYVLTIDPTVRTVLAGSSTTATINIARSSFPGAVTLAATVAPATTPAVTATISPTSTTGNTATLTVNVPAGITTHSQYTVTVTGSPAIPSVVTSADLTVIVPAPNESFTLSADATSFTIGQGGVVMPVISFAPVNGFQGAVALTATAPGGWTVSFANPSLSGTLTSTATIRAPATVADGDYQVVIHGASEALAGHDVTITVHVATPGFTLVPPASPVSIAAGSTVTGIPIGITRSNFTGAVTLTGTGPGTTGITAVAPASTGAQAQLAITVPGSVAPGTYTITLSGASTLPAVTSTMQVTVTAAQTTNVSYAFCPTTGLPVWVAVENGDNTAPWTAVTGSSGTYAFTITAGKGGLAWVTQDANGTNLHIFYGTLADFTAKSGEGCAAGTGATRTLTGTVANTGTAAQVNIGLGSASAIVQRPAATAFTISGVEPGPHDLVAATIDGAMPANGIRMLLRRAVDVSGVLPVLDFSSSEAFTPAHATLNVANNTAGDFTVAEYFLHTSNSPLTPYFTQFAQIATGWPLFGVPTTLMQAGDLHYALVQAFSGTGSSTKFRTAGVMFGGVTSQTVTLGSAPTPATITTTATSPYARLQASIPVQAEYAKLFEFDQSQSAPSNHNVSIQATGGYVGSGISPVLLRTPDFTGVAAWQASYGPIPAFLTHWMVTTSGWSSSDGVTFPSFAAGNTFMSATQQNDVTP